MKTYVLYHANCWDGFCAAWVAQGGLGENVDFLAVSYGQDPPHMDADSAVYILDFSYPRPVMREILSRMHKVVVLDHHATARDELAGLSDEFAMCPDLIGNRPGSELPIIWFDMEKSGARLTWQHFNPAAPAPWLVDYTEDRDLWRHALPYSREINAFIRSFPLDFATWDWFDTEPVQSSKWLGWAAQGEAILRAERQIIDNHVRHAREIVMDGHKILAVNATVLFSDIAGELAQDRPFGACYFDRSDGKRQWSLRSRNGGVNVAEIARAHGGGGHPQAAGFEEDIS